MMKTEKRKANVGERILITNPRMTGGNYVLNSVLSVIKTLDSVVVTEDNPRWVNHEEYEVIVAEPKPKKSARITALETQVAEQRDELVALQAKVEALEKADKYPLTERFERESPDVDGILADIERKAKPTLEALLATYPPAVKSPNEQRADVIKRAKAFVGEGYDRWIGRRLCNVEFVVNSDKRTVVALLRRKYDTGLRAKGIAKCDPDDVFNADIGKAIALARALDVDVPTEFVKAVQPTKKVIGQYVEFDGHRVNLRPASEDCNYERGTATFDSYVADNSEITDDTDAVYE